MAAVSPLSSGSTSRAFSPNRAPFLCLLELYTFWVFLLPNLGAASFPAPVSLRVCWNLCCHFLAALSEISPDHRDSGGPPRLTWWDGSQHWGLPRSAVHRQAQAGGARQVLTRTRDAGTAGPAVTAGPGPALAG